MNLSNLSRAEKLPLSDMNAVFAANCCCGCGACSAVCPANAISFSETSAGRLRPEIVPSLCVNCGRCANVCPALDRRNLLENRIKALRNPFVGEISAVYVGKASDARIFENAQSGGLLTATLSCLFERRLITHALVVEMSPGNPPRPHCRIISTADELPATQKSAYAPIPVLAALRALPDSAGDVALVGLPCHMEGLSSAPELAGKIKYRLGLLCDGVLSTRAIDYFATGSDCSVIFKDRRFPNYRAASVSVSTGSSVVKTSPATERQALKNLLTPPRCLICANKTNLFADIVYGDPWGIAGADMEHGESLLMPRTPIGQRLVGLLLEGHCASLRPVNLETALKGQALDARIARARNAAKAWRELGFALPKPWTLSLDAGGADSGPLKKRIADFLDLERRKAEDVVPSLRRQMSAFRLKSKIKAFVRKILGK